MNEYSVTFKVLMMTSTVNIVLSSTREDCHYCKKTQQKKVMMMFSSSILIAEGAEVPLNILFFLFSFAVIIWEFLE